MQSGQIAAEARPRQHRTDDDVPQRMADEAVGGKKKEKSHFRDELGLLLTKTGFTGGKKVNLNV